VKRRTLTEYRAQGDAILERTGNQKVPSPVKPRLAAFKKQHAAYDAACSVVDRTHAARDAALDEVARADAVLDDRLGVLGDKAVGAGLGTRQKPLAAFTRYAISELTDLPYKKEAAEVVAMGARIAKTKPPREVGAIAAACVKDAKTVQAKLAALVKPQAAYTKAIGVRDALLPSWTRALAKLEKVAAAAWVDEPATHAAVFAAPESIQAPKRRRARKAAKPPEPPAAPVTPG
jgi:hypothetical protein